MCTGVAQFGVLCVRELHSLEYCVYGSCTVWSTVCTGVAQFGVLCVRELHSLRNITVDPARTSKKHTRKKNGLPVRRKMKKKEWFTN